MFSRILNLYLFGLFYVYFENLWNNENYFLDTSASHIEGALQILIEKNAWIIRVEKYLQTLYFLFKWELLHFN